ncbi:tyrosine-type recombinase/integrase [Paenibacillus lactis]|uniref:Integrase n=1 Tax=Paenibacillus lactis TaxID=228574 RepID=A0ABS4F9V5_9BACL|nr:site-specific integrase [Paenibacillus lactis]MBP1893041.1 integrase [Paenibacillus lactis]HAF97498.1 site-specific integrase [Paenibacillus lactis]
MASYKKIPANNKQGYKWICTLEGPPDPVTGKRKQVPRRGETKKEAYDRAKAVVDALNSGLDLKKAKKTTFKDAAYEWLDTYSRSAVKKSTIRQRSKTLLVLLKHLSQINIDRVTHHQYQKILNTLFDEGYSQSYLRSIHIVANMIFKWAILNNLTKINPCIGATIPKRRLTVEDIERDEIEEKYLEREELHEFLSAVLQRGLYGDKEIFYLLAFSGLRPGELCALKWADINFKTRDVRVSKTLYSPENNMYTAEVTPPKTDGSVRTFDVDEQIITMLKDFKEKQDARQSLYKKHSDDFYDENFIFARVNGRPIGQKFLRDRMNRILKRLTIKKNATPHILRHTHISMLTEAGVDLPTIMARVGHDDEKTTLRIYTHVTKKMKKNASEKVKVHFGSILDSMFVPKM